MCLSDTIHYVPIKLMAVTANPRDFTERSGYMHIDKQVTLSILIMLIP